MRNVATKVCGALVAFVLLASAPAFAASRFGSLARWSAAERDEDGDVRVIAIYRDGATGERALQRLARRFVGRMRRSFVNVPGEVLKVRPERLAEVLADLEADPDVLIAEADRKDQHILAQDVPWGITRIAADPISRAANGAGAGEVADGVGVKVAVIDTGIWRSSLGKIHPDLAAVYKGGYDFVHNDNGPWDDNGHGTHVAGTIAAVDNGIGVVGVAPRVALYALKSLDQWGSGYYSDFVEAVDWSISRKMQVINYSAGGYKYSASMEAACVRARNAGITIVVAAGNTNGGPLLYPAAFDSVIAVGSVDSNDQRSSFSARGSALDLVAPGRNVESTWPGGGYATEYGTSMAAPHVSGVAALIAGRGVADNPGLLQAYLEDTAEDLGNPGPDADYGHGLVDAGAVLPAEPAITAPLPGEIVPAKTPYTIRWDATAGATGYQVFFSPRATGRFTLLAANVAGESLDWTAPATKKNLPGCRFQIAAYDSSRLIGVNTLAPFSVEIVTIESPQTGENLVGGSLVDVAWRLGTPVRAVRRIVIQRSADHGRTWRRIKTLAPDARSWQWQLPVYARAKADWRLRVRLFDRAGAVIGTGTVSFNLVPPVPGP